LKVRGLFEDLPAAFEVARLYLFSTRGFLKVRGLVDLLPAAFDDARLG